MPNTLTPENFNQTATGYLKRALRDCDKLSDEQKRQVLNNLYYAFDLLTMAEARDYYEKN